MNIKRKTTGNWAKSRAPVSASELTAIGNLLNSKDVSAIDFTSKTIHPADHRKKNYDGGARNSELRYALHGALIRSARSIRHGTSHKGSVDTTKYVMEVLELEGNFSCGAAVMPSGGEAKD